MLYLNNAATTYPKPGCVCKAVEDCLYFYSSSANRDSSKHEAAEKITWQARTKLAKLFSVRDSSRIVFTSGATESINLALKGLLKPGDHVVTTSMEHNAVTRPLYYLESRRDVKTTKVQCSTEGELDPQDIARAITPQTRLIIMTHASNVTGTIMPVEEVGRIARDKNVLFMLDAAQTAGILPIDVEKMRIDLLAFTGHKCLLGPAGTGGLYIRKGINIAPLKHGGTDNHSDLNTMPEVLPDKYEAGTPNLPGIAGLSAALDFIMGEGTRKILRHDQVLTGQFLEDISKVNPDMIRIYGPNETDRRLGIISLNIPGADPFETAEVLEKEYMIISRPGLQCSPDAHRTIGTFPQGTVRLSFGYFNLDTEIDFLIGAIKDITSVLG
jgi:cysteine desulfurase family protein